MGPDPAAARVGAERARAERAMARFHLRVGQAGRAAHRCDYTLPLIPLLVILEADGTLRPEIDAALGRECNERR